MVYEDSLINHVDKKNLVCWNLLSSMALDHCFTGSIFLPVRVLVLDLFPVFWRIWVWFEYLLKSFDGSGSASRTDSDILAVFGPVLELTPIFWWFLVQFSKIFSQ